MNRKFFLLLSFAVVFLLTAVAIVLISKAPPMPPVKEDQPINRFDDLFEKKPEPTIAEASVSSNTSQKDEKLDFFKAFKVYPAHFISHGGKQGEDTSNEYYYHATIEIAKDGKVEGTFFSNLDSTDEKTIEYKSEWTATIRKNNLIRRPNGTYFFYLKNVKYKNQPGTSEEVDGKTIKYVYAFGMNEKGDNRIDLYSPGTAFSKIKISDNKFNLPQFLSMMQKNAKSEQLDCYMIKGNDSSCYVSISDEEAEKAASGERPEAPDVQDGGPQDGPPGGPPQ